MTRATILNGGGAALALLVGIGVARLVPASKSGDAPVPAVPKSAVSSKETALAKIVQTESGPRRWLVVLAQAEKAGAAEMPSLIRSVGDDPAMLRMLAAQWAELDPREMFGSLYYDFLQPEDAPGSLPSRWILMDVLFEEWAKKDVTSAIKALSDVPEFAGRENLRVNLLSRILRADVEQGLLAMHKWRIIHYIPDMTSIHAWAERDPRRAAEVVVGLGDNFGSVEALKQVGKAWARGDPEGGLRHAATLSGGLQATLAGEIIGNWAARDLSAAVAFATAQSDPSLRAALAPGLVAAWAETDAAAALAWSQSSLQGKVRSEAITGLIKTVAEQDLSAASELAANMDPGMAQNRACASIFETWFNKGKDQRDAAFAWLAELPDPQAREVAIGQVQWSWLWNDPSGVRDFVAGPYGHLATGSLISQVAGSQTAKDPESAMKWAASLPAERVAAARGAVLSSWAQVRPEGAISYTLNLPPGKEREAAITSISQTFVYQAFDQAIALFRKLPPADQEIARKSIEHVKLDLEQKRRLEDVLKRG